MGCPDDHPGNICGLCPAEHSVKRLHHPGGHVLGGPGLHLGEHLAAVHQYCVGMRAPDIHSDASPVKEIHHSGSA